MDRLKQTEERRKRLLKQLERQAPEGWENFTDHLRRIYEEEKRRYKSLLGVHEIDPLASRSTDDWLNAFGYGDYRVIEFDGTHADGEYGDGNDSMDGGST